jgi:hypothetical protein
MKSRLRFAPIKTALLIAPLSLYLSGPTIAQGGDRQAPFSRPLSAGHSNYRAELPQGSLMVYSATDEFDDGGVLYYAHSSYTVYTTSGKLVKNVENQISRSDQIPEIVTLPIGSYIVEARSEKAGYVQIHVAIKAGHRTTVDFGLEREFVDYRALQCAPRSGATTNQSPGACAVLNDFGNKIKLNR